MVCKLYDCSARRRELEGDDSLEQLRSRSGNAPASGSRIKSEQPFGAAGYASDSTQSHNLQRWALAAVAFVAVIAGIVAFGMQ
jgi:hypothetical protein